VQRCLSAHGQKLASNVKARQERNSEHGKNGRETAMVSERWTATLSCIFLDLLRTLLEWNVYDSPFGDCVPLGCMMHS
jgi:hypothetical protein